MESADTHEQLMDAISAAGTRPVVVMFWTETCGYCHMMMPVFEQRARELRRRAHFRKVNVRINSKSAAVLQAEGLPNFKFILKGEVVHEFRGAGVEALDRYMKRVIERADQDDITLTREDLVVFFTKHDAEVAGSPESIDMLWETGQKNIAKLLELLESQYGAKPSYTGGFVTDRPASVAASGPSAGVKAEPEEPAVRSPCGEHGAAKRPSERIVILGGGPAGASAALYAGRALLCPLVITPQMGGQLMAKGVGVENFPGLPQSMGGEIVTAIRSQAELFHARFLDDALVAVDLSRRPFALRTNRSGTVFADALVIATGASSRVLGIPGEEDFHGRGVSGCATCDGYLYRGLRCLVVGGGDAALEDALHLVRICKSVMLVHRRGAFRAGRGLQARVLEAREIEVRWHSEVRAFSGSAAAGLQQATVRHVRTGAMEEVPVGAAFVAIGHDPNTGAFRGQLSMDEATGYIRCTGRTTHTSVPGVFAAGDVADARYRQAVTSAGTGAAAALDAERWLAEHSTGAASASPASGEQALDRGYPQGASADGGGVLSAVHRASLREKLLMALLLVGFALGRASHGQGGKGAPGLLQEQGDAKANGRAKPTEAIAASPGPAAGRARGKTKVR